MQFSVRNELSSQSPQLRHGDHPGETQFLRTPRDSYNVTRDASPLCLQDAAHDLLCLPVQLVEEAGRREGLRLSGLIGRGRLAIQQGGQYVCPGEGVVRVDDEEGAVPSVSRVGSFVLHHQGVKDLVGIPLIGVLPRLVPFLGGLCWRAALHDAVGGLHVLRHTEELVAEPFDVVQ